MWRNEKEPRSNNELNSDIKRFFKPLSLDKNELPQNRSERLPTFKNQDYPSHTLMEGIIINESPAGKKTSELKTITPEVEMNPLDRGSSILKKSSFISRKDSKEHDTHLSKGIPTKKQRSVVTFMTINEEGKDRNQERNLGESKVEIQNGQSKETNTNCNCNCNCNSS